MGEIVKLHADRSDDELYESRIRLIVRHPSIELAIISLALSMNPDFGWTNGDQIVTPTGVRRKGVRVGTYWTYSTDIYRSRDFFKPLGDIVEILYTRKDFIIELIRNGGTVLITAELSGSENVGSTVGSNVLQRICDMDALLGIEVFPHFIRE